MLSCTLLTRTREMIRIVYLLCTTLDARVIVFRCSCLSFASTCACRYGNRRSYYCDGTVQFVTVLPKITDHHQKTTIINIIVINTITIITIISKDIGSDMVFWRYLGRCCDIFAPRWRTRPLRCGTIGKNGPGSYK